MVAKDFINNPRTFIAGQTKRVTVLDTATLSSEAEWGRQYAFFKITPVDDAGIPAATTIDFMENSKVVIVNTVVMQMTYPDEEFIWDVTVMTGADKISLRLGAAASQDVIFQITPYEEATQ